MPNSARPGPRRSLRKEPFCSESIPPRRHPDVDYVALLIDGAPEILPGAVDSKEDLVQMPGLAEPAWSSLPLADIIGAELLTPPPNRFLGYDAAAFRQKIRDVSQAKAQTLVGPDRLTDDLGRKPIAGVARRPIASPGPSLSVCCQVDNAI